MSDSMTTATEPDGAPRLASLDILRGIAILGILFMNINGMGGALLMMWEDVWRYGHSPADEVALFLRNVFADGTARCMLEMLFGVGMVILTDRAAGRVAAANQEPRWQTTRERLFGPWPVMRDYYWRNLVLLVFGLIHVFVLLWPGDILHSYGIAAMVAFLFRRLGPKMLLALGLSLALMQLVGGSMSYVAATQERAEVAAVEARQAAGRAASADDRATLARAADREAQRADARREAAAWMAREDRARGAATGGLREWAGAEWAMFLWFEGMLLEPLWVLEAAATMLIGAALFRWGIIQGDRSRRFYLGLGLACYAFGIASRALSTLRELADSDAPTITWATMEAARIAMTVGHISAVHLLLGSALGARLLRPFEAAGRTALTLYICQTLICLWLLYAPFALGLYGTQGWMGWMLTAVVVDAGLLIAANWYVRHYRIAPVEWAWRSIVAGRRLPLRRARADAPPPVEPLPA